VYNILPYPFWRCSRSEAHASCSAEPATWWAVHHLRVKAVQGNDASLPKGDALANHLAAATVAVRNAYCECPSYDRLVPALLAHGTADLLSHVHFVAGTPVKAMLARPTNGVSEVLDKFADCEFTCEYKYDGERAQARRGTSAIWS
jgi:DNA ligase 1